MSNAVAIPNDAYPRVRVLDTASYLREALTNYQLLRHLLRSAMAEGLNRVLPVQEDGKEVEDGQ